MSDYKSINEKYIKTSIFLFYITLLILINDLSLFAASDKLLWHQRHKITFIEYLQYSNIWISILFGIIGGILLFFVKIKTWMRASLMIIVFSAFAIVPAYSGLSCALRVPSPLCAMIRPLYLIRSGNFDFPIKFTVAISTIGVLSLAGNKLFCGWVCPVGAFQEAINLIPLPHRRIKLNFFKTNALRVALFIVFFPVIFFLGRSIYFNPFAPFRWGFSADFWVFYIWVLFIILIVASIFIYRPYCYLICPIGLITWAIEHVSFLKIRYDKEKCSDCKTCIKETNCPTVESIIDEKRIRPDCHSCGKCIEVCPKGALRFGFQDKHIRR